MVGQGDGVPNIPRFPTLQTGDQTLQRIQDNASNTFNGILSNPIVNCLILKNIQLDAGSNTINHSLGYNLQGWFVTRMRNGFSQIYDTQDSNPIPNKLLLLNSSVAITVDLIVF